MSDVVDEGALALPAPPLRSCVAFYAGYRQRGLPPGSHRGLPSPHVTIVISLETPVRVSAVPVGGDGTGTFSALVGGLHVGPVTVTHEGRQDGVYVALHPRGTRALLGTSAADLVSRVVDAEAVVGSDLLELRERLLSETSWTGRFAVLDEILMRRRIDRPGGDPVAHETWDRLVASGGETRIGVLADETGWSRRHLGSRFRREFGIPPKVAARIIRFERSRALLECGCTTSLAAVAAACGYADQSHLTREWQALAGCAPTEWIAEELANVQDRRDSPVSG